MDVSVVALANFAYRSRLIHEGEAVDMAPIDAAVEARKGNVSLVVGMKPFYQTRELMAQPHVVAVSVPASEPTFIPPKRRRGRPKKAV
jgi:hypothetical protein